MIWGGHVCDWAVCVEFGEDGSIENSTSGHNITVLDSATTDVVYQIIMQATEECRITSTLDNDDASIQRPGTDDVGQA